MTSWLSRYYAEAPLQAAILRDAGYTLYPWYAVAKWLRTMPPDSAWHLMTAGARRHAAALIDECEVLRVEQAGCQVVPASWSERISPHAPTLTGQRVPRLRLDCAGDETEDAP